MSDERNDLAEWAEAGIEYAEDWIFLGMSIEDALEWDMDPMLVDQWLRVGATPSEAQAWHTVGHDARDVREWLDLDPYLDWEDIIALYRVAVALGGDWDDPLFWVKDGHSLHDTETYMRAGMTRSEAACRPVDDAVRLLAALATP